MYDYELTLVSKEYIQNDIGESIPSESLTIVYCGVRSVTRTEHYVAAAQGIRPEIIFIVNQYEYNREDEVIFDGKRYSVIRTYLPQRSKGISDFESIELICRGGV